MSYTRFILEIVDVITFDDECKFSDEAREAAALLGRLVARQDGRRS